MFQIIEVSTGTYVIPSIDNRRRKGYKMYHAVLNTYGVDAEGQLVRLDGTTQRTYFSGSGWGDADARDTFRRDA